MTAARRTFLPVLLVAALVAASAAAAPKPKGSAKQRFERAQASYDRGDYREAIVELEAAYVDDPQPIFLLNIGRCYRELGEKGDAARLFRSYLEKVPGDPNRVELEATIRELERPAPPPPPPVITEDPAPVPAVVAAPAPVPAGRPFYKKAWFWAVVGGVALAAAAGTTLWMRRDPACPGDFLSCQ